MTEMQPLTDPAEFMRFHLWLTKDRPEYTPHYIRLYAGDKLYEDGKLKGKKSVGKHNRITAAVAEKWLKSGRNVGIEARIDDDLVIIDVDDPEAVKTTELKPTLKIMSRSRDGYHYFYYASDPTDKRVLSNTTVKHVGEVRASNYYVVAPGSWVRTDDIEGGVPADQIKNAGKYTIENAVPVAGITYKEIPAAFREQIEKGGVDNQMAREVREANAKRRAERKRAETARTNYSALSKLTMFDVIQEAHPSNIRFKNPLHPGAEGNTAALADKDYLQCYSHSVTHTAWSALAVLAGVTDCESAGQEFKTSTAGASSLDYGDGRTLFKMWAYAKRDGMIPKDDPIPTPAVVWYAVDKGICKHDEIVDGWKLPAGAYSQTIALIEDKEKISTGRRSGKPNPTVNAQDTQPGERMAFRTGHLRNYRVLDDLVALEGKDFVPFIKAVWYNVIGTLKAQPVQFGNITTDTRFNLFIPMPSGTGKNNLKQAISKIGERCGKKVRSPTSFHPEQLIGKIITEKFHNPDKERKGLNDTRYIPNYGYLKKDCVVFDEAYHFITRDDKQYDESKTYIRIALDPIGKNQIQKKLVDQLDVPEQRLEYHPRCSIVMFLQPKGMDDDNVLTGFLRRFNIIYIPLVGKNLDRQEEIIRYVKHPRPEVSFDYWKDVAEWDAPTYFDFEDGINDLLIVLHGDLIAYMRSIGEKQRNYLDRKAYPIFDDLVGMSVIQAISRKSDTVTQQDVKLAYMDLFEFFKLSLDFVNKKVFGNLDYGEQWHGAEEKEIESLKWLADRGAIDKDRSEVTIKEFKAQIAKIFEIEDESARRHYSKLKKRGLIDSRRVGKDSSRVWITFDPVNATDVEPLHLSDTLYWKIAQNGNHATHLHTCTTLETDNGSGDLQVCNASTNSVSAKNTESTVGGTKNGAGCLQVCNASAEGCSDNLQVCKPEPIASGQVCNEDLRETDSELTSGASVQVCTEGSQNPIETAQRNRLKAIDRFFRDRDITYANSEELTKFVPEIADKLKIGRDMVFRSVIQYGKDRSWL